ncbi:hypothetical protein FDECE_6250, partial [Fusarium decemcellulare]
TSAEAVATVSKTISLTTSTVCTTRVHTIDGSVTTETIPLYTTVCPVTHKPTATPAPYAVPSGYETKTVCTTSVYTITRCPPEVANCPFGSVKTETIPLYTTVCPVTETGKKPQPIPTEVPGYGETKTLYTAKVYTITQCPPSVPDCLVGSATTDIVSWTTTVVPAHETQPVNVYKPAAEIPEEVMTVVEAPGPIYTTVIVPPATLKTATKPIVATEHAAPSYKQPLDEQPSGVAAPTGACTGDECHKPTPVPTSTPEYAPIAPVTAGASSLAVGLTVVVGIVFFQAFAL